LAEGDLDGIILALAGLKRLGRASEATETLSPELLLPAVGQGCLAIESRQKDAAIAPYLKVLDHTPSRQAALAERAFLKTLGGSCQTPIAALAELTASGLRITGLVAATDGRKTLRDRESGPAREPEALGERLARKLLAAGADKLLHL
jgi:hydroxymethylbilane synthase